MKRTISLVLALILALSSLSLLMVGSSAAGNYIPNKITFSEPQGSFTGTYNSDSKTLTFSSNGNMDAGYAFPWLALADVSTNNKNIMLMRPDDETKFAMANVVRNGKVDHIRVNVTIDAKNNSKYTFDFTRNGKGQTTKVSTGYIIYHNGAAETSAPNRGTYTYTYNDKGDVSTITYEDKDGVQKTTYFYNRSGILTHTEWTYDGTTITDPVKTDSKGRVTEYDGYDFKYNSDGLVTKLYDYTFTYNEKGCMATATQTGENGKAAHHTYSYTVI